MNQDELLARLNGLEWNDFECKRAQRGVPDDAYKTVSAFANTAGGWLVFGVSEVDQRLEVTGVEEPDKVQNDFLGALRGGQKFNRVVTVEAHRFEIDGKHVFAFRVPEMARAEKPLYLKGDPRQSYVRRGAGDEQCTQSELERFLRDASRERYDGVVLTEFAADSCFDLATVKWYQAQLAEQADVLALALSLPEGEYLTLTMIRSLGISTTQQARRVADHLVRQQLLDPLGATQFKAREAIRQRFVQEAQAPAANPVGAKPGPSGGQVGTKWGLSAEQRIVLAQMADEHDIATLMQWVGRSNRSKFRETVLAPMLAKGLVAMTIPDKPSSSKQRYRLTQQGQVLRDEVRE